VKEASFDAFDFLIVAFLNIGRLNGRHDGSTGCSDAEFYILSNDFIREHHEATSTWQKVRLRKLQSDIEIFKNDAGFELIAHKLGIPRPTKIRS